MKSWCCGNKRAGVESADSSALGFGGVYSSFNQQYGIIVLLNAQCSGGSSGEPTGAVESHFHANGIRDIHLLVLSSLIRLVGPTISYGTVNIAPYTLSNDGCYFSP
jgi:hypothetical protein